MKRTRIPILLVDPDENRRRKFFRKMLALGGAALAAPGLSHAQQDYWEDGDPQCSVAVKLAEPAYALDASLLASFIALSEALTGVAPLDRYLASDYLKRFATHPQLTSRLPLLIAAFREISPDGKPPTDEALKKRFLQDESLKFAAAQLIYLWYVSAFGMYAPEDPKKQITWIYDEVDQYEKALLWPVIHAHAPMMSGGPEGHWRHIPTATLTRNR